MREPTYSNTIAEIMKKRERIKTNGYWRTQLFKHKSEGCLSSEDPIEESVHSHSPVVDIEAKDGTAVKVAVRHT